MLKGMTERERLYFLILFNRISQYLSLQALIARVILFFVLIINFMYSVEGTPQYIHTCAYSN